MSALPALERYPQKTMKAIAKGGGNDFVQDETHWAISFDDYVKKFCAKTRGAAKQRHVAVASRPFAHVPSTLDALVLSESRADDGEVRPSYVFFEFKNCDLFRKDGRGNIRLPLELGESMERDLDHKLYDSAIMMVHLGRTELLTGFTSMDAYVVCAADENQEYASRISRLLETAGVQRRKRFAAYASIGSQDDVLAGLVETCVAAFRPSMATRLEGYLYRTIGFITERQLPRMLNLVKNVHP